MFTFKNVGKEMCFWARFFLTVLTVLWILAVCVGAVALYLFLDESGMGDMIPGGAIILPVVGGILTFLFGYLVIRFSTIQLYAQGKMVEHLASIDRKLDEMHTVQSEKALVEDPYAAPFVPAKAPVFVPTEEVPVEGSNCAPAAEVSVEDSNYAPAAEVPVEDSNCAPAAEVPVEDSNYAPAAEVPVEDSNCASVAEVPASEPVKTRFCMNCGKQNAEGSRFCINCGSPLF